MVFTSSSARAVVRDITNDLTLARQEMPARTADHIERIIQELHDRPLEELPELPRTWADIETCGDLFMDHYGLSQHAAAEMFYPEHTEPFLRERGCTAVKRAVNYMADPGYFMDDEEDNVKLVIARRRVLEVHLTLIHNIPMDVLDEHPDLAALHFTLESHFYRECGSQPLPTLHCHPN